MVNRQILAVIFLFVCAAATLAQPLDTSFTYRGELSSLGAPANGTFDMQFRLYDALTSGTEVGGVQCADNVGVANGRFTILLDFGTVFAGQQRFLEIDVRADAGLGCEDETGYTTLAPRQSLTAVPNASFALSAAVATSATNAANAASATVAASANLLNGEGSAFYQNATNLISGTIADTRLSSNTALLNSAQTFSAAKVMKILIHTPTP